MPVRTKLRSGHRYYYKVTETYILPEAAGAVPQPCRFRAHRARHLLRTQSSRGPNTFYSMIQHGTEGTVELFMHEQICPPHGGGSHPAALQAGAGDTVTRLGRLLRGGRVIPISDRTIVRTRRVRGPRCVRRGALPRAFVLRICALQPYHWPHTATGRVMGSHC
jgi:hypothetical protein